MALKKEIVASIRLATPLAILQIAMSAIGVVGMAVVGRIGDVPGHLMDAGVELGAAGLGNTLFFALAVLGTGVVLGFDPLISQAIGAREHDNARDLTTQAAYSAVFSSMVLISLTFVLASLLEWTDLDPRSATATRAYLYARAPSLLPFLIGAASRAYLQALGLTRPLIVAALLANIVNIPLSLALVLGDAGLAQIGIPALGLAPQGAAGAGWAATGSILVMALSLVYSGRRAGALRVRSVDMDAQRRGLRLGTPLSLQLGAEIGAFALVSYLAGTLSAEALAAHHVALSLASLPFQVSLALSAAAAVRVGIVIGQGRDHEAPRRAGGVPIGLGLIMSGLAAGAFAFFPEAVASILTDDPEVVTLAASLVTIAAAFQLVDGVQAIAAGALRGAGDTRATMLANLAGHYLLGMPLGVTLCFHFEMGARGLWWGLSAGLAAVSVLLVQRFISQTRGGIERV